MRDDKRSSNAKRHKYNIDCLVIEREESNVHIPRHQCCDCELHVQEASYSPRERRYSKSNVMFVRKRCYMRSASRLYTFPADSEVLDAFIRLHLRTQPAALLCIEQQTLDLQSTC